jgi:Terminase RNaseH-like domain
MTCNFTKFLAMWNIAQGLTTPKIHMKIATWLETEKKSQQRPRLLLMAFRSCGKSTLVGVFCAWILMTNPNTRILILSADLALARKMVRNVKRIIEKHPLTSHLKPDKIDQWGNDKFTVNRSMEFRDPSVLAKGITTNLTGTRADIIICDDVEVPKTSDNTEKRYQLRERLLELEYILTPQGTQIYVGTPHCWHTIYADTPRKELKENQEFLHGFSRLVLPIRNASGQSIWPEKFSEEAITKILQKTGPSHFKSQMMCEPSKPEDTRLNTGLLQIYNEEISVREAQGERIHSLCSRTLKSVAAFWDPSFGAENNDRSVVAVVYIDENGAYWLHHLQILQIDPSSDVDSATQQCHLVIKVLEKFNVPIIGLESNGIGKFLPKILEREINTKRLRCAVRDVVQTKSKSLRILEAFDALLAAKALHIHQSVLSTPFVREMEDWHPERRGGHDDCLDAVAGAIALQPIRIRRGQAKFTEPAKWIAIPPVRQAKTDFEI